MKRIAVLLGTILLSVSIMACGGSSGDQTPSSTAGTEANKTTETEESTSIQKDEANDNISTKEITLKKYKDILDADVKASIDTITENADPILKSVDDTYDSYTQNKQAITTWYASTLSESNQLYETITDKNIECYKLIAAQITRDSGYDWNDAMDDVYDAWDDAMEDYYKAWDRLYEDIYDKWDEALEDDSVDYEKKADAWDSAYNEYSSSWQTMYEAYSEAWNVSYTDHSEVWSGFFSDDFDVDKLIKQAKEKHEKEMEEKESENESDEKTDENNKSEETGEDVTDEKPPYEDATDENSLDEDVNSDKEIMPESESSTDEMEPNDDIDTVFEPQDVSDTTIESIKTYGDYLTMYKMIIDDYFSNYERVIKDTVLYDETSFQKMKDQMNESFKQQEEQYGVMKNAPLVGKDDLVKYLKEYRDSLQTMVDTYEETLKSFQ